MDEDPFAKRHEHPGHAAGLHGGALRRGGGSCAVLRGGLRRCRSRRRSREDKLDTRHRQRDELLVCHLYLSPFGPRTSDHDQSGRYRAPPSTDWANIRTDCIRGVLCDLCVRVQDGGPDRRGNSVRGSDYGRIVQPLCIFCGWYVRDIA